MGICRSMAQLLKTRPHLHLGSEAVDWAAKKIPDVAGAPPEVGGKQPGSARALGAWRLPNRHSARLSAGLILSSS